NAKITFHTVPMMDKTESLRGV
ncbi:hypothetical protein A5885_000002, partial [Enterococcus sp. 8E11_MSG4843]